MAYFFVTLLGRREGGREGGKEGRNCTDKEGEIKNIILVMREGVSVTGKAEEVSM